MLFLKYRISIKTEGGAKMNVFDKSYELIKALQELPDFKEYKRLADLIKGDEIAQKMLIDFRKKNFEIQKLQLEGKPIDQGKVQEAQKLYEKIKLNGYINQFLAVEYRLGKTMVEVQRIISEGIKLEFTHEEITH